MTSRQRLLTALRRRIPDRLPVTTHHLMPYFLTTYMNGMSSDEFFDHFGMDAIKWTHPLRPNRDAGEYFDPGDEGVAQLDHRPVVSDNWRIRIEAISISPHQVVRYSFVTPRGELTMVLQSDQHSTWIAERLIKRKSDIDLLGRYCTTPLCDVEAINRLAEAFGERGIVRGRAPGFDPYGQPGTWQDAACLIGIEKLILATYDDPHWVHELLAVLLHHKMVFINSLKGAAYDLIELGGGDASSTVISPHIFETFVAPYDSQLVALAHAAGQRVVYHTCGGMMPILESIAAMGPDAMETFTPEGMGGDVNLAEAKRRIGHKVCMIGGFDQFHFLKGCAPRETRAEVRRCFQEAGSDGGYIICPSDHFFDADLELIQSYADEARSCLYR